MALFAAKGTVTAEDRVRFDDRLGTMPRPEQHKNKDEPFRAQPEKTGSMISRTEKGDEEAKDRSSPEEDAAVGDRSGQEAEVRQQLAKELYDLITKMMGSAGTARLASHLQLLRKALARCHDVLGQSKGESDYLSIVVLAEREIGKRDWKAITKQELQHLRTILRVGVDEPRVTYDHYNAIQKQMIAENWLTGPVLDTEEISAMPDE